MKNNNKINIQEKENKIAVVLLTDIKQLIDESKKQIALNVHVQMSYLYWKIGNRINTLILKGKRADYGSEIVVSLSRQLLIEHGDSFSEKNLRRMMQFATVFGDEEIVVSLIRQLSWSHLIAVIPIDDPLKREFYIQMSIHEKWSVRVFRDRIKSMLYERTAISKKPEETIKNEKRIPCFIQ